MRALVVTHGAVGRELVRAAESIVGSICGLDALTNEGRSTEQLAREVAAWLEGGRDPKPDARRSADEDRGERAQAETAAVVFVDVPGGSCSHAARLATVERPTAVVISGVNLAMLVGFASWRDSCAADELVARVLARGREVIDRMKPVS